jgi:hypothetical protein
MRHQNSAVWQSDVSLLWMLLYCEVWRPCSDKLNTKKVLPTTLGQNGICYDSYVRDIYL